MASRKVHKRKKQDLFEFFHVDPHCWPQEQIIDQIVTEVVKPRENEPFPGVAVAVRQNQQLIHLNCYGYANLETGVPITPDTVFDLGSLSKQFTAIAVLNLVLDKKLDLNDHLSKYFKRLPRYADSITVEDLLHHTSALPSYTDIYVASRRANEDWYDRVLAKPDHWYPQMGLRRKRELTNKDVMQWIATQKLLPRAPDTEYEYSNSGYVILAELVAKVSGHRLSEYLNKVFFKDMKMKDSYAFDESVSFPAGARQIVNHAKCYNRVNGRFVPVGYTPLNFITGDGNVHSTIKDLLRWELSLSLVDLMGLCFPEEAKEYGEGFNFRDILWSPVMIKKGKHVNYGAGWNLRRDKYKKIVEGKNGPVTTTYETRAEYHRGEWLGWRNYFARGSRWPVPKPGKAVDPNKWESLGIVVLSNADFGDKQFTTCRIAQEISRLFWGRFKKDNIMNNFNCG
ncbi:MAG TPA: serine hydrolase domain-containing protein [Pyrinomonadaceae bacterium]|jgi:CubicO group peptidase (beta-lactamase class C family)|nr:serine hydrolase domain-containing protein [Pyrinomonadaceae bacterium]